MALLAAPAALAGLRALGVDQKSAELGIGLAKKAFPIAKSLFRVARGRHKKTSVRRHLSKLAPELKKNIPGLLEANERYKLTDQLSKLSGRRSGVEGSMLKKVAMHKEENSRF
jgi:hypothetical protein